MNKTRTKCRAILLTFFTWTCCLAQAQNYEVLLRITDGKQNGIEGASILINDSIVYSTDANGRAKLSANTPVLIIGTNHFLYSNHYEQHTIYCDTVLHMVLRPKDIAMGEIVIFATRNQNEPISVANINSKLLRQSSGSTLMGKLDKLGGVASIDIGQGFSKPSIRGLSGNRVVVTENGIKQQGQQWGMDHGLEIDPYSVENVDIIKGPSSLAYGSDAIGGVIAITPQRRLKNGLETSVTLNANSVNQLVGSSVASSYQNNHHFVKGRLTYTDYADYRVPAESFEYMGYTMPIYNGKLKNTAGRSNSLFLSGGLHRANIESALTISNVNAKMGFFSGAHGIPGKGSLEPDGKDRNIDLPYQQVNHLKLISNNKINTTSGGVYYVDLSYQFNHRQEHALAHQHGSQPMPTTSLELDLRLKTATGAIKWQKQLIDPLSITAGINTEVQNNQIGGYSFLLPQFDQQTVGAFVISRYTASSKVAITYGVRYDYGQLHVVEYIDNYIANEFRRAEGLQRSFDNFSFSLGAAYNATKALGLKFNIGKSFRMPSANELASNGVHHGTFRYEIGNPTLNSETAYQADASIEVRNKWVSFSLSGFATYFNNYIYLDPTGQYSISLPNGNNLLLPDVGQIYRYTAGLTVRWGGESDITFYINTWITAKSSAEYVYATDVQNNYPIPFTPPLGVTNSLTFGLPQISKKLLNNEFNISHRYAASQKRIRNEDTTPSLNLFDAMLESNIALSASSNIEIIASCNNLFDTKYFNHISFYRPLGLPEAGRNFTLSLFLNF